MELELDWLKRWNMYSPRSVAIHDWASDRRLTYSDLFRMSNAIATQIKSEYGLKSGDRVAVLSKNHWLYVPLFFALQRLNVILVPLNFRLAPRELDYVIRDSESALLIHSEEFSTLATELPVTRQMSLEPLVDSPDGEDVPFCGEFEDVAMILYTSGTTGAPKGAMISRKMIFWNSINTSLRLNLTQSDIHIAFLPLFHTGGWNVLLTPFLHRGARTIFLEKFEPDSVLQIAEQHRATILFGVPTMMDMMAKSPRFAQADLASVRYAVVGGEPMPLPLIHSWQDKGIPIRQGYGLTEFGPNVFSLNEEDSERKIGSIGFPNFYIHTRVVDDQGHPVGPNEVGELLLKGPMAMTGYWRHPEATSETLRHGWLHTGDLVRLDQEGYCYVVGRKKDMFISGGENVYPAEVEQCLRGCPGVDDAAVIGVPDEKWGEVGKAFLVLKSDVQTNEQEILAFCRKQIAKYKVPKYFRFVPELPKGDSGKLLKRQLKEIESVHPS